MSSAWRIASETVRQKWKVPIGQEIKRTSNARNNAIMKECITFADAIKDFEKEATTWQQRMHGTFAQVSDLMQIALPRDYSHDAEGNAVSGSEPQLYGHHADQEAFSGAAHAYIRRSQEDVSGPIRDWLQAYKVAQASLRDLETLRLELDSRRRTVEDLKAKVAKLESGKQSSRQATELQQTQDKLQHKEEKFSSAHSHYLETEQSVHYQLRELIQGAANTRAQLVAFMRTTKECFSAALAAIEPISHTAPLISVASFSSGVVGLKALQTQSSVGSSPEPSPALSPSRVPSEQLALPAFELSPPPAAAARLERPRTVAAASLTASLSSSAAEPDTSPTAGSYCHYHVEHEKPAHHVKAVTDSPAAPWNSVSTRDSTALHSEEVLDACPSRAQELPPVDYSPDTSIHTADTESGGTYGARLDGTGTSRSTDVAWRRSAVIGSAEDETATSAAAMTVANAHGNTDGSADVRIETVEFQLDDLEDPEPATKTELAATPVWK